MSRNILFFAIMFIFAACADNGSSEGPSQGGEELSASDIIARSVTFHGGEAYQTAFLEFSFRDKEYAGSWNSGDYSFSRTFNQNGQVIQDVLTPASFERFADGELVAVPDTMIPKYSASVNSVWYFAYLPFRLLDPAVQAKKLEDSQIDGISYYKIEVTFSEEGGGEDFEDVFVYWFDKEDFSLDFLAYSYAEDHGIGLRFREAFNQQKVSGILFQDYVNYKADPATWKVGQLDSAYAAGMLDTLSMILLEDLVEGHSSR